MAATSFYGGGLPLQAKHLAAYEGTEMTHWLRGTAVDAGDMRGDPRKMVAAMIEAAEQPSRRGGGCSVPTPTHW